MKYLVITILIGCILLVGCGSKRGCVIGNTIDIQYGPHQVQPITVVVEKNLKAEGPIEIVRFVW